MTRNFGEMLEARWAEGKHVCVGLDPVYERIPESVQILPYLRSQDVDHVAAKIASFTAAIVDATKDFACAYKPNLAFYARYGRAGYEALAWAMHHFAYEAPGVPVILDAKYADIGHTNEGYASYAFGEVNADAVTVHPYLGAEAMMPFLKRKDKGVIVLCRTSNPGAGELQNRIVQFDERFSRKAFEQHVEREIPESGVPLYQYVAYQVATKWNENDNCAVVVGATYPKELAEVRKIVGDMRILIPGIGAQGGDLEATVNAGRKSRGRGMIINSSRGIIYASDGEDFAEAARAAAEKLNSQIVAFLNP